MLKRPLMYISLSFVAGMYILSAISLENAILVSVVVIIALILLLIKKFCMKNTILLLVCSLVFVSGCVYYDTTNDIKGKDLYNYRERYIIIESEVITTPVITDKTVSFISDVKTVKYGKDIFSCEEKIRLSHFIDDKVGLKNVTIPEMNDIVSVGAVVYIPDGAMNTDTFDYSRHLKSDDVFFQGEINLENLTVIKTNRDTISYKWEQFRQKCISFFDMFPSDESAVLKAFVLGDKSCLTPEIRESFSGSGLSHVLTVSGLHVSVFIVALADLLRIFETSRKKQIVASMLGSLFFVFFTGASVSAIRAGVMGVMALVAKLTYRRADSMTVLSIVAALFCLLNPYVIYDASFMLSFGATAGILIFFESISSFFAPFYLKFKDKTYLYKHLKKFFDGTSVGIAAQIFIIPMLVHMFNGFSVMSVISTVTISALLKPALVGGMLFCMLNFVSVNVAAPFGGLILIIAKIMIAVSEFFGGFAFSKVIFGKVTPFLILIYSTTVAFFIFAIRKEKLKSLVSLICTALLTVVYLINSYMNYNTAQVSFINVGQGDCALVKAPGNCDVLIDAGGNATSKTTGEYVIYPYLIKNGVYDIEYIVLSHLHADHVSGLYDLMDLMDIKNIVISRAETDTEDAQKILSKAYELGIPITYIEHGDVIFLNENIKITAIAPDKKQLEISDDDNDKSLVVRLDYGENSFLFTGDITSETEKYILHYYPDMVQADVLKVAHHGSEESTCEEFINAVNPEYAYIPVGKNNSFGHPSGDVLERLCDVEVYRADRNRDVTFYFDDENIKGIKYSKKQ